MNRRRPLVSQHLEGVAGSIFENHHDVIRNFVSKQHGVYALYHDKELYYVGLASNLRARLSKHLRDRHRGRWNRFSVYLTMRHDHMRELESLVVRIAKPGGNKQVGRFAESENLKPLLDRSIRRKQSAEISELFGESLAKTSRRTRRTRSAKENGRTPVMADYVTRSLQIRRRYKGRILTAQILKNGVIRFNGTLFNSPSQAGAAAMSRRTCNGWKFWRYERAPGDWVPLAQLRS